MGDAGQRVFNWRRREQRHAQTRQRAGERDIGRDPHHQHNHEAAQITAAQPRQRAETAIARQRHAIAESQAAQHGGKGVEGEAKVDGLRGVEQAKPRQGEAAQYRHGDRQHPHPHPHGTVLIQQILDRAEGAEPSQPRGQTQHHAAEKTDQRHQSGVCDVVEHRRCLP